MSPLPPFRFSWFWDFFSVLENHFAKSVDESSHLKARSKNPLASLLEEVEGSKMVVPRLEELSPAWTMSTNPHLRSISDEFQSWVDVWFKDERIRKKIADLNADGFAAMAYPRTGRRELLNLAKLIAWYFPWDDAIDDAALAQKPENIIQYRDETIELVQQSLSAGSKPQTRIHLNPAIQSFWDIGAEIRSNGTIESNQQFAEQQCLFITSSAQAQIERESDTPVTVEEYLKRREDNIAIHPLMSLIYYAYRTQLPPELSHLNNKHMNLMWKEIAWMGTMSNDVLSLRRELLHGQFESLVPLLMYHYELQPQEAIQRAVEMIHQSYERFYKAEQELYAEVDPESLETVKACILVFKDLVMCNLHWSYGLKRYMEKNMVQENGSVTFDIRLPENSYG